MMEKKEELKTWDTQVNNWLLTMMFVDIWLVFEGCTLPTSETQREFYTNLSEELINNTMSIQEQALSDRQVMVVD